MKTFKDIKRKLSKDDPALFFRLEIVGKLMAVRVQKELSQRELSRLSGVPQKTISRLESGLDSPRIDTLGKLASALGMKIIVVEDTDR